MGSCGLDSSGSGQGPVEGSCENSSIKGEKFSRLAERLLDSQEGLILL
jgi:hypothetical protein